MKYRLLIAIEVIEILEGLPEARRSIIWNRLRQVAASPQRFSDYTARDAGGRELDVHVFAGFAIRYWEDFTDRHVKILEIQNADRGTNA